MLRASPKVDEVERLSCERSLANRAHTTHTHTPSIVGGYMFMLMMLTCVCVCVSALGLSVFLAQSWLCHCEQIPFQQI